MATVSSKSMIEKEPLGAILIKRHRITEEQLLEALKVQEKKDSELLGEILIGLGYLDEKDIVVALMLQCGLPYIAIDKYDIPDDVLRLVPRETAEKLHVVPLDKIGDVLSVVMANPLDEKAKGEIGSISRCKVAPFIATKVEIDRAIVQRYSGLK